MQRKICLLPAVFLWLCRPVDAAEWPYPPAAGQPGSTAIYKDSSSFVAWATGYVDYHVGPEVDAQFQTPGKALGKAVGDSYDIVTLGRGGRITMTFSKPIINGSGWDFAVFENSISDTFLELAWVEVSSDGIHFFRFANFSWTREAVTAYGNVDPTYIHGYAGKYRQGYGTPFDLDELKNVSSRLDVNNVSWVRLIDIVGDGNATFSYDGKNYKIFDPYPTTGSAGFDLDAIGVIHQARINLPPVAHAGEGSTVFDTIHLDGSGSYDPDGRIISFQWTLLHDTYPTYDLTAYGESVTLTRPAPGVYMVTLEVMDDDGATDNDAMSITVSGYRGDSDYDWDVDGLDVVLFSGQNDNTLEDIAGNFGKI